MIKDKALKLKLALTLPEEINMENLGDFVQWRLKNKKSDLDEKTLEKLSSEEMKKIEQEYLLDNEWDTDGLIHDLSQTPEYRVWCRLKRRGGA